MRLLHGFGILQLLLALFFQLLNLGCLAVQLKALLLKLLKVFACRPSLVSELLHIQTRRILEDPDLLQLFRSRIQSGIAAASLILDIHQLFLDILHVLPALLHLSFQFLDFPVPA